MLILASTGDLIQAISSAAVTVDVQASWVDWNGTTATPGRLNSPITTATTTSVVPSPGSSVQRTVKSLTFRNKHASSSQTLTIQHFDNTASVTSQMIKVTLLAGETLIRDDKGVWFVYDVNGAVKSALNTPVDPKQNDFRLTGVSVTPVMTADNTSLSTIYMTSYKGNRIALFDGTNWQLVMPASETSLAVTGRTTDLPFDIFCYNNAGVATLEFLDWTNSTTRATGLTRVDGVWTKTGDSTRRYLGSCRARSATTFSWVQNGTDAPVRLDLFNADNRVDVNFTLKTGTDTWAYTIATWRQAQGSTNAQVDIMVGLQEESFFADLTTTSANSTISIARNCGIGFDSTTVISGIAGAADNTVASINCVQTARVNNQPAIGRHFYAWLEISTASGTCTWQGDNGALRVQSGMTGYWTC